MATQHATTQTQQTTTWDIDPAHSSAGFAVRHLMISTVRGRMAVKSGTIVFDERHPEASRVEAVIDATSVDTGATDRDNHLRSTDFFDAANHPTLRFESTRVEALGEDKYRVTGDLTIRGVTRAVTLDVEKEGEAVDPWGNHKAGLVATTTIDRTHWGLTWNAALEAGGVLVADKVKLELQVQARRR